MYFFSTGMSFTRDGLDKRRAAADNPLTAKKLRAAGISFSSRSKTISIVFHANNISKPSEQPAVPLNARQSR